MICSTSQARCSKSAYALPLTISPMASWLPLRRPLTICWLRLQYRSQLHQMCRLRLQRWLRYRHRRLRRRRFLHLVQSIRHLPVRFLARRPPQHRPIRPALGNTVEQQHLLRPAVPPRGRLRRLRWTNLLRLPSRPPELRVQVAKPLPLRRSPSTAVPVHWL